MGRGRRREEKGGKRKGGEGKGREGKKGKGEGRKGKGRGGEYPLDLLPQKNFLATPLALKPGFRSLATLKLVVNAVGEL